jgi:hypothetical protein
MKFFAAMWNANPEIPVSDFFPKPQVILVNPEFDYAPNQVVWDGLVDGELNKSFSFFISFPYMYSRSTICPWHKSGLRKQGISNVRVAW